MSATALIAIDGVMRKLVGSSPIPEGMRLYSSLAATGPVIVLAPIGYKMGEVEQVRDWMELHGVLCPLEYAAGTSRLYLANRLRRNGAHIDLIVEPDPRMASEMIKAGYNTLLFTHSQYAHPSWRPDTGKGVQPWTEITQQVADLARMKAVDERLRDNE